MRSPRIGRAFGGLLALIAPTGLVAPAALAHTPVGGVLVLRPDFEEVLQAPLRIVLQADGAPGSGPGVVVWLYVDGNPVDPGTGEIVRVTLPPFTMNPGQRLEIEVARIDPGTHNLTVEVSPSETEQPGSVDVPFVIQQPPDPEGAAGAVASVILTVVLVGALVLAYRRLRPRAGRAER